MCEHATNREIERTTHNDLGTVSQSVYSTRRHVSEFLLAGLKCVSFCVFLVVYWAPNNPTSMRTYGFGHDAHTYIDSRRMWNIIWLIYFIILVWAWEMPTDRNEHFVSSSKNADVCVRRAGEYCLDTFSPRWLWWRTKCIQMAYVLVARFKFAASMWIDRIRGSS